MNREYVRVLRRVSSVSSVSYAVENPGTGIWLLGEVYLRGPPVRCISFRFSMFTSSIFSHHTGAIRLGSFLLIVTP